MAGAFIYSTAYYFKYNANVSLLIENLYNFKILYAQDWTRKGGWRVIESRRVCNPGDPGFPKGSERSAHSDYASRGFKNATI